MIFFQFSFKSCFLYFFIAAAFSENSLCLGGLKVELSNTVSPTGPPKQGLCVCVCVHHCRLRTAKPRVLSEKLFLGLLWILACIRHRVTSVLTEADAETPTDLSEKKVYSNVRENHILGRTLPDVLFKENLFQYYRHSKLCGRE